VVVKERKKREWERPTDRRMRPGEVFNCEESWDFVSLGAVLPSIDGRRNTDLPAQLSPFQDVSSSYSPHSSSLQDLTFCARPESLREIRIARISTEDLVGWILIPVFPVSRVNPGGRTRSRVLDQPAVFHEDPYRLGLACNAPMRNRLKEASLP